jgi:hypothetical protein
MGLVLRRRNRVRPVEPQDTAQRPDPALLLKSEFCCNGFASGRQNRIEIEALKVHARRFRDFTYANGGTAAAKLRREAELFGLISITLKYLHVIFAHLSVLRYRCDEPAAKRWRLFFDLKRMRPHLDFCAAARRQAAESCGDGRHQIAEKIPQRSRAPVTFRSACAQIEQCARDGGRSRNSVNSNPPRGVVAFNRF